MHSERFSKNRFLGDIENRPLSGTTYDLDIGSRSEDALLQTVIIEDREKLSFPDQGQGI
jgi:hypothetical protein